MLTVHGVPQSPFVRKVLVALEEKGIPYRSESLIPFPKTPELLAKSPLGKIPFIVDGDFVLRDSSVICAYLERKHPKHPLFPSDVRDFARALWFEEYGDTRVFELSITPFFERWIRPNLYGETPDEERVEHVLHVELPPVLDYLEREVGDGEGVVGGRFSIADIALCSPLATLRETQPIAPSRWPRLAAYVERVLTRPSFARVMAPAAAAA